jgi:hypothetical protein
MGHLPIIMGIAIDHVKFPPERRFSPFAGLLDKEGGHQYPEFSPIRTKRGVQTIAWQ